MNVKRCPWVNLKNPNYIHYHDNEWGRPVFDDREHFELISLEGAQAGLSWETILKKRDHYRDVFNQFNIDDVAKLSDKKLEKILLNPGIVRHRLKIFSVRNNAKCMINVQKEFGSFNKYIWDFTKNKVLYTDYQKLSDYPSFTPTSVTISKDLKKRGFMFVGETIIYAYMQAAGICQDHSTGCYLYRKKF